MITHKEGIHNNTEFRGIIPCRLTRDVSNLFLHAPVRFVGWCRSASRSARSPVEAKSGGMCRWSLRLILYTLRPLSSHQRWCHLSESPVFADVTKSCAMNDRQTWGRSPQFVKRMINWIFYILPFDSFFFFDRWACFELMDFSNFNFQITVKVQYSWKLF